MTSSEYQLCQDIYRRLLASVQAEASNLGLKPRFWQHEKAQTPEDMGLVILYTEWVSLQKRLAEIAPLLGLSLLAPGENPADPDAHWRLAIDGTSLELPIYEDLNRHQGLSLRLLILDHVEKDIEDSLLPAFIDCQFHLCQLTGLTSSKALASELKERWQGWGEKQKLRLQGVEAEDRSEILEEKASDRAQSKEENYFRLREEIFHKLRSQPSPEMTGYFKRDWLILPSEVAADKRREVIRFSAAEWQQLPTDIANSAWDSFDPNTWWFDADPSNLLI